MRKVTGYFLRIFSISFFIVLIILLFNVLFVKEVENQDSAFKMGYYFGAFLILTLFSWLLYKLFKYSGKFIASNKVTNQVNEIGKDNL